MRTVVKVSGTPIEHPERCPALWAALAQAAGAHELAIVHGGGRAVDERLARLGLETSKIDGVRITPADQIGVVAGVLAGEVNRGLVAALTKAGGRVAGIGLSDAGLCVCRAIDERVYGRVGRVVASDGSVVHALWSAGVTPVVHSIGQDEAGPLNVNADEAAAGVARAVGAHRLVLLTGVAGVLNDAGAKLGVLDAAGAEALIGSGVIGGGMAVKVRSAVSAAALAGCEVVIASWDEAPGLLANEKSTDAGTRIVATASERMDDLARGPA